MADILFRVIANDDIVMMVLLNVDKNKQKIKRELQDCIPS